MYIDIGFSQFCDAFSGQYKDNFSYNGKRALFDYLESVEEDGEAIELDTVGLCCDFTEYADFQEVQRDYPFIKNVDQLRDNTSVIEIEGGGLIIQQF